MANVFSITITAVDRATSVAQQVNRSIAQITKPISDVKASISAFSKETGMDKLGRSIEKVGIFATESARRVASIAPPVAALTGAATIAGVVAFATSWGRSAKQISNTAYNIGIGTTQLQEYQGAARLAGLSSDSMTNGMKSLGIAMEEAQLSLNPNAQGALAHFGIGIHRLKNGSVDTARAMRDIADVASKLTNAQARSRFLDIFGLGELAPLLGKGSQAIDAYVADFQKLNAVMSPEQIEQGRQYDRAMISLDASVDKLKNSIGSSLAPALGKVADEMIPIANEYGPKIAHWIESTDWAGKATEVKAFVDSIGGVQTVAAAVAAITFAGPIAGAISLAGKLASIAGTAASLAANPVVAGITAAGVAGYEAGKWVRQYYDKYTRWATGGDRWSLNDYLTGTHRNELKDTGGYRQDELDSVKDRGGAKLAAGSEGRLKTLQRAQHQGIATSPQTSDTVADSSYTVSSDSSAVALPNGAQPLGLRTNNPLNLQPGGQQSVFATPEDGIAAAVSNLQRNYRGLTIAEIHDKWTGGARTGNSPLQIANYQKILSQATGLGANEVPDLSEPRVVSSLVAGMIKAENGRMPYTPQQIGAATLMGMQGKPGQPIQMAGRGATDIERAPTSQRGGKVEVLVRFENPPPGATASVRTRGSVSASTNLGHSALLGVNV